MVLYDSQKLREVLPVRYKWSSDGNFILRIVTIMFKEVIFYQLSIFNTRQKAKFIKWIIHNLKEYWYFFSKYCAYRNSFSEANISAERAAWSVMLIRD